MAIELTLSSCYEDDIKTLIKKTCIIKPKKTTYNTDPESVVCFSTNEKTDSLFLPLGVWSSFLNEFPIINIKKINIKCKKELYTIDTDPKGYRDQDIVAAEALEKLRTTHTVFIAAPPGFGKTSMGNYLGCKLGHKILEVCHIKKVNAQWYDEFTKYSTAKVCYIKDTNKIDYNADVYIIGVQKLGKLDNDTIRKLGIGTVIFDEAHVATITAFSNSLLKVCPVYVIGLSATPERSDGMQSLLKMYFGPKKDYIIRHEIKDFTVYKYETDYEPNIDYTFVKGSLVVNWTEVINSLAYNKKRQYDIACIAWQHQDHNIMILSDRIEECRGIYSLLTEWGDNVYLMKQNEKNVDKAYLQSQRVLIAGRKMAGTGFDDPTRNLLILCTDCKDVRQNEGRIRTVNNIVYDIVDNYKSLERHWSLRETWYLKRGATVKVIPRTSVKKEYIEQPTIRRLPKNTAPKITKNE